MNKILLSCSFYVLLMSVLAFSNTASFPTITQLQGTVEILKNPQSTPHHSGKQALFEGRYYQIQTAKVGNFLPPASVIQTSFHSKVEIIYPNGDQFYLGAGSTLKLPSHFTHSRKPATVKLYHGNIRSIIEKKSPNRHLLIRTRNAVMGVRGTDFYLKDVGSIEKGTELSVVRGKVAILSTRHHTTLVVHTQEKAILKRISIKRAPLRTKVQKTHLSSQDLKPVLKLSLFSKTIQERHLASLKPSQRLLVQKRKQKAKQVLLKDIQQYDPVLYKKVKNRSSLEAIHQAVFQKETARKPSSHSLKKMEQKVYEKYYKK